MQFKARLQVTDDHRSHHKLEEWKGQEQEQTKRTEQTIDRIKDSKKT
jgi:hypothetical protein